MRGEVRVGEPVNATYQLRAHSGELSDMDCLTVRRKCSSLVLSAPLCRTSSLLSFAMYARAILRAESHSCSAET